MQSYKKYFSDKNYLISFFGGLIFLTVSLVLQFFISGYVTRSGSGSVTDIILSNTRVYDVGGIFVWGINNFDRFLHFCSSKPTKLYSIYDEKYRPFYLNQIGFCQPHPHQSLPHSCDNQFGVFQSRSF